MLILEIICNVITLGCVGRVTQILHQTDEGDFSMIVIVWGAYLMFMAWNYM